MTAVFGKVKGHATKEMVENGSVRQHDKIHNDVVDRDASRGIQAHGSGVKFLAKWLAARHKRYAWFMHRIRLMIIACHRADAEERGKLRKEKHGQENEIDVVQPIAGFGTRDRRCCHDPGHPKNIRDVLPHIYLVV